MVVDGKSSSPSPLDELNFTAEEQNQHIASITEMFKHRLDDTLRRYIQRRLEVALPSNLAEKFGGEVDLTGMLVQKKAALQQAHVSMFASAAGQDAAAQDVTA